MAMLGNVRLASVFLFILAAGLAACGDAAPGSSDIEEALNRMAGENAILWGDMTFAVTDSTCTEAGEKVWTCDVLADDSDGGTMRGRFRLVYLGEAWQAEAEGMPSWTE